MGVTMGGIILIEAITDVLIDEREDCYSDISHISCTFICDVIAPILRVLSSITTYVVFASSMHVQFSKVH